MPFASADLAFGPYLATYKGSGLGGLEGTPRFSMSGEAQDIRASEFGESVVDGVYRGGNAFLLLVLKEWNPATKAAMWPFGADLGLSGVIGRSMVDMAGVLLLSAVAGTTGATKGPVTRSFPLAIFSPGHNKEVLFGTEERNVPIVLRCYPTKAATATLRWFTDT